MYPKSTSLSGGYGYVADPWKVQGGKHSRWFREMQRRWGCKLMWEMVSFTGRFDPAFLSQRPASQPDGGNPPQPSPESRADLKMKAVKHRGNLRWAEHLDRKRKHCRLTFSDLDTTLLRDLDSGKLRKLCNDATKEFGHGRIRMSDGSHVDIGSNVGGATRTLLDDFQPPVIPSSDEEP